MAPLSGASICRGWTCYPASPLLGIQGEHAARGAQKMAVARPDRPIPPETFVTVGVDLMRQFSNLSWDKQGVPGDPPSVREVGQSGPTQPS